MKILRIVSSGYEEGGVENGIVLLRPVLQHLGHTDRVLSSDMRPDLPHFNEYEYRAPRGVLSKLYHTFNPHAYFTLKRILKEFQPDVVHLHTIGYASPSIFFALRSTPTVAMIHGPEGYTKSLLLWCLPKSDFKRGIHDIKALTFTGRLRYVYYRYINYPLYRIGLRNVDVFVTLSRYMQSLMAAEGIRSEYIPNAAMIFDYRPLDPANAHTLLYVGRLEPYKGVDYLIRSLADVRKHVPDVRLLIAGEGSERGSLEMLAKDLGLRDHVSFLGHVARPQMQSLYEHAALVVMPSTWPEAFGKVGIEAMSVGRPVVATDVGGVADWLMDGANGILVRPKDADALSSAIKRIFADEKLFERMSECARTTAAGFSVHAHAMQMEKLYEGLMKERRSAATQAGHASAGQRIDQGASA